MRIEEYHDRIKITDKLSDISSIKFGLFGEVGSILTSAKKRNREGESFDYISNITEELGDAFWYFSRLIDRLGLEFQEIVHQDYDSKKEIQLLATSFPASPIAHAPTLIDIDLQTLLPQLGIAASSLLHCTPENRSDAKVSLRSFLEKYINIINSIGVSFASVLENNLAKCEGRFILPNFEKLPKFDSSFQDDERLPDDFEIEIVQRSNGKTYLKWHGVFIGDPLTDNISEEDGYRFHDVFHMANAAILHWSPTFRALIRHKRKSDPKCDEVEDGGRAIVIEEGLTAWIFSNAKEANFFSGREKLSFDLLKCIKQFVKGFEVEECPASLWEKAILDGYKIFREVKDRKNGIIIGSRSKRSIEFREK